MSLPTLVQSISGTSTGSVTSYGLTFPSPTTTGNTILVLMANYTGPTTAWNTTDNVNSGNYARDIYNNSQGDLACRIARFPGAITGGTTTVTTTSTTSGVLRIWLSEWSGLMTSGTIPDQSAAGFTTGNTSSLASGNTGALQVSGELVIGFGVVIVAQTTFNVGSGFTQAPNTSGLNNFANVEYLIASGTAAQNATFTIGSGAAWNCLCATYIPTQLTGIPVGGLPRVQMHWR